VAFHKLLRSKDWLVTKAFRGVGSHKLLRSQDWLVAKASGGVGSYDSRSEDADERELEKVHDGKSAKCC
jgi:hypothetical protein